MRYNQILYLLILVFSLLTTIVFFLDDNVENNRVGYIALAIFCFVNLFYYFMSTYKRKN